MREMRNLVDFIRESNAIEGIHREPTREEVGAHELFLDGPVNVENLCSFVNRIQPGALIRARQGMNVRVGPHRPPPGGPQLVKELQAIIDRIETDTPYETHMAYETLHPFMDGNGRSGRAIWLWQMMRRRHHFIQYGGFLHTFYYQSLQGGRAHE